MEGAALRCYLICTVQRTGSWMLCHALEDTRVAGVPAEYFHRGDERFWATRWGVASGGEYFAAMLREQRSPNGVYGGKMMWNYFDDALGRLKEFSQLSSGSDADILTAALPGLRFVWLRRRDFVRQGVSWWKAAVTGQYALACDVLPAPVPSPDYEEIDKLVTLARESDRSWQHWFQAQQISPLQVFYEDMVQELKGTVLAVLAFVGVKPPLLPLNLVPRLRPQSDQDTERLVKGYSAKHPSIP